MTISSKLIEQWELAVGETRPPSNTLQQAGDNLVRHLVQLDGLLNAKQQEIWMLADERARQSEHIAQLEQIIADLRRGRVE
jgi:hypothetical protein